MTEEQQRAFQQLSAEQQFVTSNIDLIRQQMDITRAYLHDMQMGLRTLDELKSHQADEEVLMSIGGGMLVTAKLVKPGKVIRDAGSGVKIEATIDQAIERSKELIATLESQYQNLERELEKLTAHATNLDTQLRDLLAKVQPRK
ncbi:MAG: prefoldin subunit alpha [Candidatus Thorarchaeota archaeon]|nr:prefoldin subunit alpha [Candidatus Thorarchaeota archaeon]